MNVCLDLLDPQTIPINQCGTCSSFACISHHLIPLISLLILGLPSLLATGLLDYSPDRCMHIYASELHQRKCVLHLFACLVPTRHGRCAIANAILDRRGGPKPCGGPVISGMVDPK